MEQDTLSDFLGKEVKRTGDIAEIVYDHYEGDKDKPVRLIGFVTDASKTDFEILEEGYHYYLNLCEKARDNETEYFFGI